MCVVFCYGVLQYVLFVGLFIMLFLLCLFYYVIYVCCFFLLGILCYVMQR